MYIKIQVKYVSKGLEIMQRGEFKVLPAEYKKDPDWTVATIVYEWIREIKLEVGYPEDFAINEVIYNEQNDITQLVKQVRPIINDDFPF